MTIIEKYRAASKEYAAQWNITNDHVINVGSSILMTRDNVLQGGGFVQAVVNNDLREAIGRADDVCINHLRFFVGIKNNVPRLNEKP